MEGLGVVRLLAGPSLPVSIPAFFLSPRLWVRRQPLALYWYVNLSFRRELPCCSAVYVVLCQELRQRLRAGLAVQVGPLLRVVLLVVLFQPHVVVSGLLSPSAWRAILLRLS